MTEELNDAKRAVLLLTFMAKKGHHFDIHTCRASIAFNVAPTLVTAEQAKAGRELNMLDCRELLVTSGMPADMVEGLMGGEGKKSLQ